MAPKNASVLIDISGISTDKGFVREVLAGWLGQQGYLVQTDEKAHYQLSIIVESLGTEYGESFFGMPQVSSTFIPVSLPELALYKAQYQTGYVKFYCNIFELPTGRFIQSTPSFIAEIFYNEYTVCLYSHLNQPTCFLPRRLVFSGIILKPRQQKICKNSLSVMLAEFLAVRSFMTATVVSFLIKLSSILNKYFKLV
ncbi:MAG TPA: hypothetical protein PKM20_10185 [Nitrosomonas sp.]|nr:hypothetical protein [Nitrosomonas sp.]